MSKDDDCEVTQGTYLAEPGCSLQILLQTDQGCIVVLEVDTVNFSAAAPNALHWRLLLMIG